MISLDLSEAITLYTLENKTKQNRKASADPIRRYSLNCLFEGFLEGARQREQVGGTCSVGFCGPISLLLLAGGA